MNKNYVIINIKTNGEFNIKNNSQITAIEAIKVDVNLNKIDEFNSHIKLSENNVNNKIKTEQEVILEFVDFIKDSKIITYKQEYTLSFLLKSLYKNQITKSITFKYHDIFDLFKSIENINLDTIKNNYHIKDKDIPNTIINIVKKYLQENNLDNLNDLFLTLPFHGKTFRGLNYPKYLCDIHTNNKKYYGYIVDYSIDKYISYYSYLKELNKEYFTLEEINMIRSKQAKIIMNLSYLNELSLLFTDYYSVQAVNIDNLVTANCKGLINGINTFLDYQSQGKNIKLVLWGTTQNLKKQYNILGNDNLNKLISFINIIKEPWDYWYEEDLTILNK